MRGNPFSSMVFRHVPDLLSTDADGAVTLWDVRNPRRLDEEFTLQSDRTRSVCAADGSRYEVLTGLGEVERLNLLWLHGYRRRPKWQGGVEAAILAAAAGHGVVLDDLFALDDGSGRTKSSVSAPHTWRSARIQAVAPRSSVRHSRLPATY
jgi:hypothetical protein